MKRNVRGEALIVLVELKSILAQDEGERKKRKRECYHKADLEFLASGRPCRLFGQTHQVVGGCGLIWVLVANVYDISKKIHKKGEE